MFINSLTPAVTTAAPSVTRQLSSPAAVATPSTTSTATTATSEQTSANSSEYYNPAMPTDDSTDSSDSNNPNTQNTKYSYICRLGDGVDFCPLIAKQNTKPDHEFL